MSASKNLIQAAAGNAGGDFYPYTVDYSARFDLNSYLYRTGTSTSSTWTLSFWIKRTTISYYNYQYIFSSGTNGFSIGGTDSGTNADQFYIYDGSGSGGVTYLPQKYRDPSAWQHWVVSCNAGTATVYANNTTVGSSIDAFSLSTTTNGTTVGRYSSGTYPLGAYLAQVALVDGSVLTPSSFAEDKNGIWVPKDISGLTFGTSGFWLDFADSSALGTDVSGNGNNFTSSGLVSSDQMIDTPTNNFATCNPVSPCENLGNTPSFAEGNLRSLASRAGSSNGSAGTVSTFAFPEGNQVWYKEARVHAFGGTFNGINGCIGINPTSYISANPYSTGIHYYSSNGYKVIAGTGTAYGSAYTTGDIIGILVDPANADITFYKNGVSQGTIGTATHGYSDFYGWLFSTADGSSTEWTDWHNNYGQDGSFAGTVTAGGNTDANDIGDFKYTVPTGALALCTANLPEPTIGPKSATTSDEHFDTALYTGNGATTTVSSLNFQPDFTWIKSRGSARYHALVDVLRGSTKILSSNSTAAEDTVDSGNGVVWNSTGFEVDASSDWNSLNLSGESIVAWNWKANGSGVSNTDGNITSTVSANQDAGISIVSYTGDGTSSATIGHGLGVAPNMIILKITNNTTNWPVYHSGLASPNNSSVYLDLATAVTTPYVQYWNNTDPTDQVFSVGTWHNEAQDHIAYCFAEVEGFSSFGSYTGNGSTNGPFVYTGFRPAFVIVKSATSAYSWMMHDSARSPGNQSDEWFYANFANAEETQATEGLDLLSNGFKIRTTNANWNHSGQTFIYMAFAENPFKYANAR